MACAHLTQFFVDSEWSFRCRSSGGAVVPLMLTTQPWLHNDLATWCPVSEVRTQKRATESDVTQIPTRILVRLFCWTRRSMLGVFVDDIAHCDNLCVRSQKIFQQAGSAPAQANEPYAWLSLVNGNFHHGEAGAPLQLRSRNLWVSGDLISADRRGSDKVFDMWNQRNAAPPWSRCGSVVRRIHRVSREEAVPSGSSSACHLRLNHGSPLRPAATGC